jgi:hypothetical protein
MRQTPVLTESYLFKIVCLAKDTQFSSFSGKSKMARKVLVDEIQVEIPEEGKPSVRKISKWVKINIGYSVLAFPLLNPCVSHSLSYFTIL